MGRRRNPFRQAVAPAPVVRLADLFPMKDGAPNPSFIGLFDTTDPNNVIPKSESVNRKLRARGLLPLKWVGTRSTLADHGITVERHDDADVVRSDVPGQEMGGGVTWWAVRWAVLLAEADPLNEAARSWAFTKAQSDTAFKDALDAFATLADSHKAREKMAALVLEAWEP